MRSSSTSCRFGSSLSTNQTIYTKLSRSTPQVHSSRPSSQNSTSDTTRNLLEEVIQQRVNDGLGEQRRDDTWHLIREASNKLQTPEESAGVLVVDGHLQQVCR